MAIARTVSDRARAAWIANLSKRGPLTDAGRRKLRDAAIRSKPSAYSTGPRTEAGKRRSRLNARTHGQLDAARRFSGALLWAARKATTQICAASRFFRLVQECPSETAAGKRKVLKQIFALPDADPLGMVAAQQVLALRTAEHGPTESAIVFMREYKRIRAELRIARRGDEPAGAAATPP